MLALLNAKSIKELLKEKWPGVMIQTIKNIMKKLKHAIKILKKNYIEKIISTII